MIYVLGQFSATRDQREPAAVPTRVELCKADQVAPGTALRVEAGGLTVAVFNVDGQFDIKTGEIVSPPCMIPVKTYPATVEGGTVFIEVD